MQTQLLHQDADGVWHVRVFTGDGGTLASQLVSLGLGRLATPNLAASATQVRAPKEQGRGETRASGSGPLRMSNFGTFFCC